MKKKEQASMVIEYVVDKDGLQRVVCGGTEINLNNISEEQKLDWLKSTNEIVYFGLITDFMDTFEDNEDNEDNEDDEDEVEEDDEEITLGDILEILKRM